MQTFMKIGSVAAIIAVFLSLGIALSGLFGREIVYVFAALPFVIAGMVIWKKIIRGSSVNLTIILYFFTIVYCQKLI